MRNCFPVYLSQGRGGPVISTLRGRGGLLSLLVSVLLLVASAVPAMAADLATEMINELMCPSDCVETLAVCQMPEAVQMRAFVKDKVAAGWSRDQITDNLVSQYGERILAAPTKKGFNLTAWVTPFAAILGGGVLIAVLVAAWARQRKVHDAYVKATVSHTGGQEMESYRARLSAELDSFE